VKNVYPYRAFDIENPKNDKVLKVNEHRLNAYFDNFPSENKSIGLRDLFIKIDYYFSLTLFLCDFCFASIFPTLVKWQITILYDS
jgi:hypothetical protein